MTSSSRAGRPRRSSAEILADAASELFLENGYDGTTVDQIAQRAGVSRATFFNYFAVKSDLLWLDLDATLAGLPSALQRMAELPPVPAAEAALIDIAERHDPRRVPWALSQGEAMQLGDHLATSASVRFVRHVTALGGYLAERVGEAPGSPWSNAAAAALLGAAAAGTLSWVRAGTARRPLDYYVQNAISSVARGLATDARSAESGRG